MLTVPVPVPHPLYAKLNVMIATEFEYRHRYFLHALIYVLGFSACWEMQWWSVGQRTVWGQTAEWLLHHGFGIQSATHAVHLVTILFAVAGAALRWWGAAYLGASTVQRDSMVADRVVADGPYRYVRNPLYLGTVLNTLAVVMLMQPAGAGLTMVLIVIYQIRLIMREEPYLSRTLGPVYDEYCKQVPRLLPRLRSKMPHGGAVPRWGEGFVSEIYVIGTALSFAVFSWRYFEPLVILQGILVSVGISLVARAFIPKRG